MDESVPLEIVHPATNDAAPGVTKEKVSSDKRVGSPERLVMGLIAAMPYQKGLETTNRG